MEHYICYQDENGNPAFKEVEVEEPVVEQNWHISDRTIRVVLDDETWKSWLSRVDEDGKLLQLTGKTVLSDLTGVVEYVKDIDNNCIVLENGILYVYLNELYPAHELIIKKYGGIIETKPII